MEGNKDSPSKALYSYQRSWQLFKSLLPSVLSQPTEFRVKLKSETLIIVSPT